MTVVTGSHRRHHFRHLNLDAPHQGAGETLLHFEAKHAVARWAESTCPAGTSVEVEPAFLVHGENRRRPDVEIRFPGGTSLVVEVECFNSTTAESLEARRGHYRRLGIADVWVFGAGSKHAPLPLVGGQSHLPALPAQVCAADHPVRMIDPLTESVTTCMWNVPLAGRDWWERPGEHGLLLAPSPAAEAQRIPVTVRTDPLAECRPDPRWGIVTPAMRAVWASRASVEDEAREAEAADAERRRRAADAERIRLAKRMQAVEKAREAQERQRSARERGRTARKEAASRWRADAAYDALCRLYGEVPAAIADELPSDSVVQAAPAQWHGHVWLDGIAANQAGDEVTVETMAATVTAAGLPVVSLRWLPRAVTGYLDYLVIAGMLAPVSTEDGHPVPGRYRIVTTDLRRASKSLSRSRKPTKAQRSQRPKSPNHTKRPVREVEPRTLPAVVPDTKAPLRPSDSEWGQERPWEADLFLAVSAGPPLALSAAREKTPTWVPDSEVEELYLAYHERVGVAPPSSRVVP